MPEALPTTSDALRRLDCLRLVSLFALRLLPRLHLRDTVTSAPAAERAAFDAQADAARAALRQRLEAAGVWSAMTPPERALLSASPLDVDPQAVAGAVRSVEAAAALLWAVGLRDELPPFDALGSPAWLAALDDPTQRERASLRPATDLARARDVAELWHWRSRTRQLVEAGHPFPRDTGFAGFDDVVRATARAAADRGDLPAPIEGDFLARGVAYRALPDRQWREVASIAQERHHALNWLCGYAPDNRWDLTPTET